MQTEPRLYTLFRKRILVFVILFFVSIFVYFIYYTFFVFHMSSSSPSGEIMPTSYSTIIYKFNKPLKKELLQKNISVRIDPEDVNNLSYSINDRELIVSFLYTFEENEKFTLYVDNIESQYEEKLDIKMNYTAKYVELKDLPAEDVRRLTSQSDSFEKEFPLVKYLPIEAPTYSIDYQFPDKGDTRMPIIISSPFDITTNNSNGVPSESDKNDYVVGLRESRRDALSHLRSIGYNEKKYKLYFSEPYVTEEFKGEYLGNKLD